MVYINICIRNIGIMNVYLHQAEDNLIYNIFISLYENWNNLREDVVTESRVAHPPSPFLA